MAIKVKETIPEEKKSEWKKSETFPDSYVFKGDTSIIVTDEDDGSSVNSVRGHSKFSKLSFADLDSAKSFVELNQSFFA